ncbi:MAG: hypothetical protein JWO06_2908 [Bacteroidota bacterium]|nr:hypothetical protein [Bacteroidota bacterium]
MKKIFSLSILFCCVLLIQAQPAHWGWARNATSPTDGILSQMDPYQLEHAVAADPVHACVYAIGSYKDTTTFGNVVFTPSSYLEGGAFIVKYDSSGNLIWAKSSTAMFNAVAADGHGNIYVTGSCPNDYLRYDTSNIYVGHYTTTYGIFLLLKIDSLGNLVWLKTVAGAQGFGITCDYSGHPCVTGDYMSSSPVFGSDTLTAIFNNGFPIRCVFVARFDTSGNAIWARGSTNDGGYAKGADAESISANRVSSDGFLYVTGGYNSNHITFDTITLTNLNYTGFSYTFFIAAYDSSGNVKWAKTAQGNTADPNADNYSNCVTADNRGNAYVSGTFFSPEMIFGNNTLYKTDSFNYFHAGMYVVKYDVAGNLLWAKGGNGSSYGISADSGKNIYVTGGIGYPYMTFGGTTIVPPVITGESAFIFKCDSDGNVFASTQIVGDQGAVSGISADPFGSAYIGGTYSGPIVIGADSLAGTGAQDNFTARLTFGNQVCHLAQVAISGDTSPVCANDSIHLCAPTGFAAYSWNDGQNTQCVNLNTSSYYTVTVTDNSNCSTTSNILNLYFYPLPLLSVSANGDSTICTGQSLVLTATTFGQLSYLWSNNDTTATTTIHTGGLYSVTVTEALGCANTGSVFIATKISPVVNIVADKISFCPSDSAHICATTLFPRYYWSTGDTGICIRVNAAGNYNVFVTDTSGCTAQSNQVAISLYTQPQPSIIVTGDTLSVSAEHAYQWYLNGNAINGATLPMYIVHTPGNYTVEVSDTNGCNGVSAPVNFTGINDINSDGLSVYPNPTSGAWELSVENNLLGADVEVFDSEGKSIYHTVIRSTTSSIQMDLAAGVYLLRINASGTNIVKKLVRL